MPSEDARLAMARRLDAGGSRQETLDKLVAKYRSLEEKFGRAKQRALEAEQALAAQGSDDALQAAEAKANQPPPAPGP